MPLFLNGSSCLYRVACQMYIGCKNHTRNML